MWSLFPENHVTEILIIRDENSVLKLGLLQYDGIIYSPIIFVNRNDVMALLRKPVCYRWTYILIHQESQLFDPGGCRDKRRVFESSRGKQQAGTKILLG